MDRVDVAIVGAGPVGAAFAAMLAPAGHSVRILEAREAPSRDARTLALSHASRDLLEEAGGWPASGVTPIADIHVSQKGGPGRALITAAEQGLDALGYTVAYAALEESLRSRLAVLGVDVSWGAGCEAIELDADHARLRIAGGGSVEGTTARAGRRRRQRPAHPGSGPFREGLRAGGDHRARACGPAASRPGLRAIHAAGTGGAAARRRPVRARVDRHAFRGGAHPGAGRRSVPRGTPGALRRPRRAFRRGGTARVISAEAQDRQLHRRPCAPRSWAMRRRPCTRSRARGSTSGCAMLPRSRPSRGQGAGTDPGAASSLEAYRAARRRDAGRGVAFTDFLVGAFMDDRRLPTWGRGLALTALDVLPAARKFLATRMIHGAPSP